MSPFPASSPSLLPTIEQIDPGQATNRSSPEQSKNNIDTNIVDSQQPSVVGPSKTGNLFLDFTTPPTNCRIPKLKSAAERAALASGAGDLSCHSAPSSPMVGRRHSLPKRASTPSNQLLQSPFVPATVPSTPTTPRLTRKVLNSCDSDDATKRNVAFSLPDHAFVLPDQDDQEVFDSDELDDPPGTLVQPNGNSRGSTPRLQRKPGDGKAELNSPASPKKGRSLSFGSSAGRPTLSSSSKMSQRRPITPEPTSSSASSKKLNGPTTPTAQKNFTPPGMTQPKKIVSGSSTLPRRTSKAAPCPPTPTTPTVTRKTFGPAATKNNKLNKEEDVKSKTLPLPGTLQHLVLACLTIGMIYFVLTNLRKTPRMLE
ncbi:hypothetical protein Bpfe_004707 [Biomphalaria pfeifferi]|uniref:Uncharacterized protein n=1 Tax=Biomphalaria pfeifferi TaxID=112525 RepID=A0AAD8C5P2_BIOPF|nr:hypothetical protein Bpfe_004707 [Biomphalaria pfeifferi]